MPEKLRNTILRFNKIVIDPKGPLSEPTIWLGFEARFQKV